MNAQAFRAGLPRRARASKLPLATACVFFAVQTQSTAADDLGPNQDPQSESALEPLRPPPPPFFIPLPPPPPFLVGDDFSRGSAADVRLFPNSPRIGGVASFRYSISQSYDSEEPRVDAFETFPGLLANPEFYATDHLTFYGEIRAETIKPATDDRVWEDVGLFVRSLYGVYDFGSTKLTFGKFTPSFAVASLVTPGIFGNSYSKDYELIERLGFEVSHEFAAGDAGTYSLNASTFFKDTSFLSDSALASRGQLDVSDGGAGNTEDFSSFALSFSGREISALPGLFFQLGVLHQEAGEGDFGDERGIAFAITQEVKLTERDNLLLIGEVAHFENFEGTADDIEYYNLGVSYLRGPWNFVMSGTSRQRELSAGGEFDDYSIQLNATYDFGNGWIVGLANETSVFNDVRGNQLALRIGRNIPLGRSSMR